jgi:hypothetical protein
MVLATDYLKSNWLNAEDLNNGLRVMATIVSAGPHTFLESGDTELTIRTDYIGKGIVLNLTRKRVLIAAFGVETDNWIGKQIVAYQGDTLFQGKPTKCVVIEAIVAERIASHPAAKPALEPGKVTINDKSVEKPYAPPHQTYDGPDDLDDSIPWDD